MSTSFALLDAQSKAGIPLVHGELSSVGVSSLEVVDAGTPAALQGRA